MESGLAAIDKNNFTNMLNGTAFTGLGKLFAVIFHFLSTVVLARGLSLEGFGVYALILAFVHVVKVVSGFGLDLTLVKYVSSTDRYNGVLWQILILRTIVIAFVSFVFMTFVPGILNSKFPDVYKYCNYIFIIFLLSSYRELLLHLIQSLFKFKQYALVEISSAALKCIALVYLYIFNLMSLTNVLSVEVVLLMTILIIQYVLIPGSVWVRGVDAERVPLRQLLKFSFQLYGNNLLTVLNERVNFFIMGIYLAPVSIANFEVATKIPMGLMTMFRAFIVVYFPNSSNLVSSGCKDEAHEMLNFYLVIFSYLLLGISLVVLMFSKEIIKLIFSSAYLEASTAFCLLAVNFYLRATSNIMGYSLVSYGHPEVPVRVNAFTSCLLVVASFLMVPRFGFMGAVYSLLIINFVSQFAYCSYLARYHFPVDLKNYLRPLLVFVFCAVLYLAIGAEGWLIRLSFLLLFAVVGASVIREVRQVFGVAYEAFKKINMSYEF